jgi:hypothetical protein
MFLLIKKVRLTDSYVEVHTPTSIGSGVLVKIPYGEKYKGILYVATCAHVVCDVKDPKKLQFEIDPKQVLIQFNNGSRIKWKTLRISKSFFNFLHDDQYDIALFEVDTSNLLESDFNKELSRRAMILSKNNFPLGRKFSLYGKSRSGFCVTHCTINAILRNGVYQFLEMPPLIRWEG